jgi:two-component system, OmpR family, response regulator
MTAPPLGKILYAEDDPDIREIAVLALETLGAYTVETIESGDGIVERARAFGPDLIILDVMMPGVDGPAALRALRDAPDFANTPVLFMTAKVLKNEIEELRAMGAQGVIAKPFDATTLAEQVQDVWENAYDG